jgi:Ca2+-transporting ATPase
LQAAGHPQDPSGAITGAELDDERRRTLKKASVTISVYARVQPEHKVRIVNAWRKRATSPR